MRQVLLVLLSLTAAACASVGPRTVPRDQFDYNAAIAESSQQQLLVNLVRLRYAEAPVFLKVSSVISQYSRIASVNAGAAANAGLSGDNTASVGGGLAWADRPTITYSPVSGQEFSQNLLTPIPPRALFEMMQAGWPAELVLRLSVWSINDVDNDIARPSRRRQADPELFEFFRIWRRLRDYGVLGIRKTSVEGGQNDLVLFLRSGRSSEVAEPDVLRFRELLDIDPDVTEIKVVYGLVPENPGELAVLTGSIWDIMLNLAWQFEVPDEHVESGRTDSTFQAAHSNGIPPIQVHFSKEEPEDVFVAVHAHGYWFYVDQHDRRSKRAFSFLQLLLSLAETSVPDNTPVVTISN